MTTPPPLASAAALNAIAALAAFASLATSVGCTGRLSPSTPGGVGAPDAPGSPTSPTSPTSPIGPGTPVDVDRRCAEQLNDPGAEPLRMLTQAEVNAALKELLPGLALTEQRTSFDTRVGSFVINGEQRIQKDQVLGFRDLARQVAQRAAQDVEPARGCAQTHVHLLQAEASGASREAEVYAIPTPALVDALELVGHGNEQNAWTSIFELRLYEGQQRVGVRAARASAQVEGRGADAAIDGDATTRWAAEGDAVRLTLELERQARIDRVEVQWFDGDARRARFTLLGLRQGPPSGREATACRDHFLERFVSKAWRRPLQPQELAKLQALYDQGMAAAGDAQAVQYVVEAILQSPSFMYHHEQAPTQDQPRELDDHELAHRLATLIWRGLPDEALLEDARAGKLRDPQTREQHARRMMDDERAALTMRRFVMEWFSIDALSASSFIGQLASEPEQARAALALAMRQETERFIDETLRAHAMSYQALLTARMTWMDEALLRHHGLSEQAPAPDARGLYALEPAGRAGLLGQTSFLTLQHGPIHRGQFIRAALLCSPVPGPSDDINTASIEPVPGESMRQVVERRMQVQPCGGCHQMMDPMGLTMEPFDDAGRWRTQDEHGNATHGQGRVVATTDINGPVDDLEQLSAKLAASADVRACVARQLMTFGLARRPERTDTCTQAQIEAALADHDGDLREALVALVRSPTFSTLSPPRPGAQP